MMSTQTIQTLRCQACDTECQKFGKHRNGLRRFRCPRCRKTYTEPHELVMDSMYISHEKAVLALQLLLEGSSIRSTERITGLDMNTIMKLLVLAGERCQALLDSKIHGIDINDCEVDEVWGFVFKKEVRRKRSQETAYGIGDAYCFIGIERTTKLIVAHHLGKRDQQSTDAFMSKLANATSWKLFQLSTDGFRTYPGAVQHYLGSRVDFAQIIKVYGRDREGEQRYSAAEVIDVVRTVISGNPDPERICTSYVERQNLSIRMGMRRMTRLTNAFSKKWENLQAAYSLWFAYYNFCRIHSTLKKTPAMAQGITDHGWTINELIA
jgi:transposase-like protein/IS1 family transposase